MVNGLSYALWHKVLTCFSSQKLDLQPIKFALEDSKKLGSKYDCPNWKLK